MKLTFLGILLIVAGQAFAQTSFGEFVKIKDSLNVIYFKQNRDKGQFDKSGLKTGCWTEYRLLTDSANNTIPVVIQGLDLEVEMEFPSPSILQKAQGTYKHGMVNGKWQWFEADFNENELIWELSRKAEFKNGKKTGSEVEFDSFGDIRRKAKYINDRLNGIETLYWHEGVIFSEIHWKNGVLQNAEFFYQDGQIKMKTQKVNRNSLWAISEYHENGKLKASYHESGEGKEGQYLEYDESGVLIITKHFKNGNELEE